MGQARCERHFQAVKDAADDFVKWVNEKIKEQDKDTWHSLCRFVISGSQKRPPDPDQCSKSLPKSALEDLSKCLVKFDRRATVDNLQSELKSLAVPVGQAERITIG